jgi:hypothetical protein
LTVGTFASRFSPILPTTTCGSARAYGRAFLTLTAWCSITAAAFAFQQLCVVVMKHVATHTRHRSLKFLAAHTSSSITIQVASERISMIWSVPSRVVAWKTKVTMEQIKNATMSISFTTDGRRLTCHQRRRRTPTP